ncbi:MAG: T9SS type A sorting domain-containing protein, partial [Cytophagales bacterium]
DFLGFSMSSGGDVGAVSLVRRTGTAGTNNFNSNQSIAASWDVTPDEPTVSRNVRFRWVSSFDNVTDPAKKFQVYRFSSGPGWTEVGSLQNLAATSPLRETAIVSVNINDTFTVTDETQVLPVELVSFSASSSNGVVQLFWKTASELNNESFTIERSRAGEKFEDVQTIKGMGTTPTATNYTAQDVTPYTGISYYRLRQKDFDGRTSYSNVVSVSVSDTGGWSVFPNPSDGSFFTIKLGEKEIGKSAAVELRNNAGQLVSSFRSVVDDRSEIAFKISQPLLSGFYITSVMIDGGMIRLKLIVQ